MKKRLIGATLLTVAAALLVSGAIQGWVFYQREVSSARQNLRETLSLMDAQSSGTDPGLLVDQFRKTAPGKRLTVIAPDGTVLADTVGTEGMVNHADRPEVAQAAWSGWGEEIRTSETMKAPMLYVAKRFNDGPVVRAGTPLSTIGALARGSVGSFFVAAVLAFVLALVLARSMARHALKPLNAVGDSLQTVLNGGGTRADLSPYYDDNEVGPILRSIDRLVERLGVHIEDLRAERDKVNLILDCMDEGLLLLDKEGRILSINTAAKRFFGVRESDHGGSVLLLTRSRRLREALQKVRTEQAPVMLDLEDPSMNGRSLRMFLSPVTGRRFEGEAVGCSVLISDVTELKRAEGIRSEFTANVSHELKTPLTSIKGFLDMLSSGMVKSEEDRKRFLTMMSVETDRLIDLINDILRISELEAVSIDQSEETSSPLEAARAVEELLLPTAREAGVSISVTGADTPVPLPAARLKELLLNLMENAVKYNEPGGKVDVTVSSQGGKVVLTVADTGIGIPEEARARVFERFYRVDKGRSRKNGGTGLGLAIVKHIVQLYGGGLSLESEMGKGSTFTVTLPSAH